jgi:hypothetical protein
MNNAPALATDELRSRVPAWAWVVAASALFAVYFLLHENGTLLSNGAASWLHEFTHDGRHALGVPCH